MKPHAVADCNGQVHGVAHTQCTSVCVCVDRGVEAPSIGLNNGVCGETATSVLQTLLFVASI